VQPEDIDAVVTPGRPTLNADGTSAVVSFVRPDVTVNDYVGQLWTVPVAAGATGGLRVLTRGHRDTEPRHSPDGSLVAFLRTGPRGSAGAAGRPQLHVVPVGGGEPIPLTDQPLGVTGFDWSPDGSRIAFTARVPEPGRYGTPVEDGGAAPDAGSEAPRLITHLRYLSDGLGYLTDRPSHVFVVTLPDRGRPGMPVVPAGAVPTAEQLTDGDADDEGVVFSPDGSMLAFTSARHDHRHEDLFVDAFTIGVDGTDLTRRTPTTLSISEVAWSVDGTGLWLRASDPGKSGRDSVANQDGLFLLPIVGPAADSDDGDGPARLTDPETLDLGEVTSHLTVTATGVLVQARDRGAVRLLHIPSAGGSPEVVIDGPRWVLGHDCVDTPAGRVVVATVAGPESAGELVVVGAGDSRVLTDLAAGLRARTALHPLLELSATSADGYPVHGWVVLPEGAGPHPVLLDIHGGPFTQFGWTLFDEAQVLAGAGYAMLLANPRGSAGYGAAHGSAIGGAFGVLDTADVTAFLDTALADPALQLDAARLGVLGGSYGGYLTSWITTRPELGARFSAAVVERGFLDPVTFAGTSDIGWFFGDAWCGTDPDQLAAQSPMAHVDAVRTPTLVIHSEQDYRCPIEAGQRWFAALIRQGVPAELLIFPGESHGLTRGGQPAHRVARFRHLLRWWDRYLPTGRPSDPEPELESESAQAGAAA
jgi:dipeptidyl aminopeptidase/acylaminoacyl peptidase